MNNFSAMIPSAEMQSANDALASLGYGDGNFSVPAFNSSRPDFALLHSWADEKFQADVAAIPNVVIFENGLPTALVSQAAESVGARWAADALPLSGVVDVGLHVDDVGKFWYVIQPYDTAIWSDPTAVPALVVPARMPYDVTQWIQPINQFTAYYLNNPFTGAPDECIFENEIWYVTQGDAAGLNVWVPNQFGWAKR